MQIPGYSTCSPTRDPTGLKFLHGTAFGTALPPHLLPDRLHVLAEGSGAGSDPRNHHNLNTWLPFYALPAPSITEQLSTYELHQFDHCNKKSLFIGEYLPYCESTEESARFTNA